MDDIGVLLMMTMMKICFVIINHFSECHNKQLTPFGDNDYTNDDDDEYDPGNFDNYDNDVDAHPHGKEKHQQSKLLVAVLQSERDRLRKYFCLDGHSKF